MSNSVTSGCLTHYNNQHIQVRKDFFDLCAYDKSQFNQTLTKNGKKANDEPNQECMAKILRLLETLTDHEKTEWHLKAERLKAKGLKISAEPKEYRIELAYSTIAKLLFGTYGESTIRKSIAVLLERNYIKRYQATKNSVPCYVLNIKALQAALDKQAQEAMSDPSQETEVSNLTSEDNNEVSNLTANDSNLTPDTPSENFEVSNLTANNIDKKETKTTKEREKDKAPTVTQQPQTSLQPDGFSPSLSQNVSSFSSPEEKPTKEAKPTPVDYALFDRLCRSKGYASDFRVPRNEKNNDAIKELREQGANAKQIEFVFNDIWEDKDPFWQQHRGKPSIVASQFTARVWKMTAPVEKRRTASGLANWTEDKTMGVPAIVEPVASKPEPVSTPTPAPAKPKESALPVGYTRLKMDKPARPRTAYGRRLQAEKDRDN